VAGHGNLPCSLARKEVAAMKLENPNNEQAMALPLIPRRPPRFHDKPLAPVELWRARRLLKTMVVRELKVRYKNSILGFAWSMVTPLALMAVFTFIFTKVFKTEIKDFQVFFLAGFLPWQFFSNAATGAVDTVVNNGNLIKKVYFPREILPLTTVMSQAVHFVLAMLVFGTYMLIIGYNFLPYLPLLLLVILLQTIFTSGIAMLFAAANVRFRDLRELVPVLFLIWFYGTPIIYPIERAPLEYQRILKLNPMTLFVQLYRDILYRLTVPSLSLILTCTAIGVVTVVIGYAIFSRLSSTFAKEV
jgi:ABC-type polysaccharide/polyol phosphate export permease